MTLGMDGEERGRMLVDLSNSAELAEASGAWLASFLTRRTPKRAVIEITYSSVYGDRRGINSDRLVLEAQ